MNLEGVEYFDLIQPNDDYCSWKLTGNGVNKPVFNRFRCKEDSKKNNELLGSQLFFVSCQSCNRRSRFDFFNLILPTQNST